MIRNQIWLVRLNPTEGSEIAKTRPALIVSNDAIGILPLKIIVPITDWKGQYKSRPWMVKISNNSETGLIKESGADSFQVRSLSQTRFIQKLGEVSNLEMEQVIYALTIVLKI